MIYAPLLRAGQTVLPSSDIIAPTLIHDKFIDNIPAGQNYTVEATVMDNEKIDSVTLFYRPINTTEYKSIPLKRLKDTYLYSTTIDKNEINPPGIEYYIQAVDEAGNRLTSGYKTAPLIVNVFENASQIVNTSSIPILEPLEESSSNKWLWIGLGVLVLAAAVGGGGGGGGGGGAGSTASGSTVVISAPLP